MLILTKTEKVMSVLPPNGRDQNEHCDPRRGAYSNKDAPKMALMKNVSFFPWQARSKRDKFGPLGVGANLLQ